ncbi:MAG: hypothetical protein AB1609_13445 [Bacillota bacterium]
MGRLPALYLGLWPVFEDYRVGMAEALGLSHMIDVQAWAAEEDTRPESLLFVMAVGQARLQDPLALHEQERVEDPRSGGLVFQFSRIQAAEDVRSFARRYGLLGLDDAFETPNDDPFRALEAEFRRDRYWTPDGQLSLHRVEVVNRWLDRARSLRDLLREAAQGRPAYELREHLEVQVNPELLELPSAPENTRQYRFVLRTYNLFYAIQFLALVEIATGNLRLCARCGQVFSATRERSEYCSERCRKAAEVQRYRKRRKEAEMAGQLEA